MWLPPDEIPPFIEKKTKYSKKFMLTIFWNINGFPIVKILPDINRKLVLHYGNARPHAARIVNRYMDEN